MLRQKQIIKSTESEINLQNRVIMGEETDVQTNVGTDKQKDKQTF